MSVLWETVDGLDKLSASTAVPRGYLLMFIANWACKSHENKIYKTIVHMLKYKNIYRKKLKRESIQINTIAKSKFNAMAAKKGFTHDIDTGIVIDAVWARWKELYPELSQ